MKKIRVITVTNSGFKETDGYRVDVVYKGRPYDIAVHRQLNDTTRWMLTDMNSGLMLAVLFKTRKDAVDCITVGLMESLERTMSKDSYAIARKAMTDYIQLKNSKTSR